MLDKKAIFPDKEKFDAADPCCGMGEGALLKLCERVVAHPMYESTALPVLPGNGKEPFHYQNARNNLDALIACIEQLRAEPEFALLDDYVRVRIGHATHATFEQAVRIAAAKIEVDINLGSNLSTQSMVRERASDVPYDTSSDKPLLGGSCIQGLSFDEMASVTANVEWKGWNEEKTSTDTIAYVFRQHGLLPCLLAGVHVTLGTDGEGVEHTNLRGEYQTAHAVLSAFVEWDSSLLEDPEIAERSWAARYHAHVAGLHASHQHTLASADTSALPLESVNIQKLLEYAKEHTMWMCTEPETH